MGTSGSGLASGQVELPVVVVLGQRSGPSTGIPTYTAQADLGFVLTAGHGEFRCLKIHELAPLDTGTAITDFIAGSVYGLVLSESLRRLENRAFREI